MALNPRKKRNRRVPPKNTIGGQIRGLLGIEADSTSEGQKVVRFTPFAIASDSTRSDWTPPQTYKSEFPPIWAETEIGTETQQAYEVITAIDGVRLEAKFPNELSGGAHRLIIGPNLRMKNAMIGVGIHPFAVSA